MLFTKIETDFMDEQVLSKVHSQDRKQAMIDEFEMNFYTFED